MASPGVDIVGVPRGSILELSRASQLPYHKKIKNVIAQKLFFYMGARILYRKLTILYIEPVAVSPLGWASVVKLSMRCALLISAVVDQPRKNIYRGVYGSVYFV